MTCSVGMLRFLLVQCFQFWLSVLFILQFIFDLAIVIYPSLLPKRRNVYRFKFLSLLPCWSLCFAATLTRWITLNWFWYACCIHVTPFSVWCRSYFQQKLLPQSILYNYHFNTEFTWRCVEPRVIRELEAQLEYEREKREKLEAQMDKLRAQIHTLTLQLEDERSRHVTAVSISILIRMRTR